MTLWNSPHPDIKIPTNVTTWEWLFETEQYIPFSTRPREVLGAYKNAVTNESLDLAQVREKAVAMSTVLVRDYGLQPGQTVSIFSTNTIWYAVALWATVRVEQPTLESCSHSPPPLKVAVAAAQDAGIPSTHIFLLEGSAPGFQSQQDLIHLGLTLPTIPHYTIPIPRTNKDECGYLNFSSGTTGLPQSRDALPPQRHRAVPAAAPAAALPGRRALAHAGGDAAVPHHGLGAMDVMLEAIIKYKIEDLTFVPPILIRLVRDPVVDKYLPQLRAVIKRFSSGAAPMSPEVVRLLQSKFPATGFRQGSAAGSRAGGGLCGLGVPDEYAGERPKAFVVLKQGVPVSEEVGRGLLQYVREKKVKYKWLVEMEFAESIPKGPSGKLLRRVLKLKDKDVTRKKGMFVEDETRKARL
ncbi:hypothetical protein OPQ81_008093 [Rhizoctonia solani]|nr:hypothetical protein OPQ81_008093 [Rhizoctonia solani]